MSSVVVRQVVAKLALSALEVITGAILSFEMAFWGGTSAHLSTLGGIANIMWRQ